MAVSPVPRSRVMADNKRVMQISLSDLVCIAKPSGLVPEDVLNEICERKLERLRSVPWAMQVLVRVVHDVCACLLTRNSFRLSGHTKKTQTRYHEEHAAAASGLTWHGACEGNLS
jgi:hypothetical protein